MADGGAPQGIRPLRKRVAVERVVPANVTERGEEILASGIIIPRHAKHDHPSKKYGAAPDYFRARVIGIGPDVPAGELTIGEELLVYSFAEDPGDNKSLYTGWDLDTCKKRRLPHEGKRLLIEYPDDIICAVSDEPQAEPDPFPSGHPYRKSSAPANAVGTGD